MKSSGPGLALGATIALTALAVMGGCFSRTADPAAGADGGAADVDGGGVDGGSADDGGSGVDGGLEQRTLTLLSTTDLHTWLWPYDYFTDSPNQNVGLTKIATLVRRERAANACSLLLDSGDTIQGTPLGSRYATIDAAAHPMAFAMNAVGFDAMALGNHEFNYGLTVLRKFIADARFPVLAANVRNTDGGTEAFGGSIIREVCGVKVGILGLVTPIVETIEPPAHRTGLRFAPLVETARAYVVDLRARGADVVVIVVHSGPHLVPRTLTATGVEWLGDRTGWRRAGEPTEFAAIPLAEIAGVDVVLAGHSHSAIPKMLVGDTVVLEAGRYGNFLGKATISLVGRPGSWSVTARDSTLLPVNANVASDPELQSLTRAFHDATLASLDTVVGSATAAFPGAADGARFTDNALADLINAAQLEAARAAGFEAQLSAAAVFERARLPAGPLRVRDVYATYEFDNLLYVVRFTGARLREALEINARYFRTVSPNALPARAQDALSGVVGFNYDLWAGVDYTLDLTLAPFDPLAPETTGRVTSLVVAGVPVTDEQTFVVAVNSFRGGGQGNAAFANAEILWRSPDTARDYILRYLEAHPNVDPAVLNVCNATLVPDLYAQYFAPPTKCSPKQ